MAYKTILAHWVDETAPEQACALAARLAGRFDGHVTAIAFGIVGQWCWQSPQPVQPASTSGGPSASIRMAWSATGHASRQSRQSSPLVRTQAVG